MRTGRIGKLLFENFSFWSSMVSGSKLEDHRRWLGPHFKFEGSTEYVVFRCIISPGPEGPIDKTRRQIWSQESPP